MLSCCLKEVLIHSLSPQLDVAGDVLVPLREGWHGTVLRAAVGLVAKLLQPVPLHSSGMVLVTDDIAGMGLAPGRHTLGQQVVEIDGLNTYIAGKCLLQKSWTWYYHLCPFLESSAHLAVLVSVKQHLCHLLGFCCLII